MRRHPLSFFFVFLLGAATGIVAAISFAPHPATGAPLVPCAPAPSAAPSVPRAAMPPMPAAGETIAFVEGKTPYACTAATAELLDPASSNPRIILWGDCPDGKRLSVVAYPTKLPGTARVHSVRFLDAKTGQEWTSTTATFTVTTLGNVGDVVEGELEATMSARLNRDPVSLAGRFRARRTPDRFSP